MNQGIYKLVYSKVLNMYVPASEAVRSHGAKSGRRVRKHAKNLFAFFIIASFIYVGNVSADTVLPAGLSIQNIVGTKIISSDINNINFLQQGLKATVDWNSLNLRRGQNFNVEMLPTASMLNRIHDMSPSFLGGNFNAKGNLYFINTNGIIIGKDAQFNVGSIYAGTLDITDELFKSGFVNENTFTKAFELVGSIDPSIQTKHENAKVIVEGGAQINTSTNGKVLLFAPTVTVEKEGVVTDLNGNVVKDAKGNAQMRETIIHTPDGQTILAAGKKIYLKASKDPAGFLVEVDSGGTATNLGKIIAERGNITMMGLAVNQAGTLSATTSVRANGSIRLIAQDKVSVVGVDVTGTRNGIVTLTKGSVTEVNPEYANKEETIASQAFSTSDIKIEASLVNIDGKISAKGGNVTVAALNPASADLNSQNPSRIYLGNNAEIDVSGVDAVAPMSRNQLEIQLFSDQLKDAPILRDSGLFKEAVYVDARKGTDLFDIQPFLALKGATVAEKMTKAGTIALSTPNQLIVDKGAVLNVSGGSTTYEAGNIKETNLFYNGKLVPISEAKSGIPYDKTADVYIAKDAKWGVTRSWDLSGGGTKGWGKVTTGVTNSQLKTSVIGSLAQSYLEGDDAGTLNLTVPDDKITTQNLVLAGQLLANTKVGTEQLLAQKIPLGGKLIGSANQLVVAKAAKELTSDFVFEQKLPDAENFESVISTDFLAHGFNRVELAKVTKLTVSDTISLQPQGSLVLSRDFDGNTTQINADIIAPSSDINLAARSNTIADGVKITTAGLFTNDRPGVAGGLTQPRSANGGNITANLLTLGKNVTLDTSAGASVNNKRVLTEGDAGNIKFTTNSKVDDSVTLQAYGFKQGGALSVAYGLAGQEKTLNIAGNPNTSDTDIDIATGFFNKGGFSKYELSAFDVNIGNSAVAPQEIYATSQTLQMNSSFANQAGGQPILQVASAIVQPESIRKPVSLTFTADKLGGVLTFAENTTIHTDRGGSVSLAAGKQVNVLGNIITPSGNINININDKNGTLAYDPTQVVYIGAKATLSATGSSLTLPDSKPDLLKTQVFNAGSISVDAPKGAVVVKDGAVLDVSGTSIVNDTKTATSYVRETLHGDAGNIKLSASDGLLLDGTFKGVATGTGRAGTLDIGFTNNKLVDGSPILSGSRQFTITQQKQLMAEKFSVGDSLKTASGDAYTETSTGTINAQISAEQVKQGGFANLKIKSFVGVASSGLKDSIQLTNGLDLQVAGNLKLETPLIQVKDNCVTNITASHITLKSPNSEVDNANVVPGSGKLITHSKQLYIDGLVAVGGVKETTISTTLDISGQGTQVNNGSLVATQGGLVASGDINLTARQIYPNTGAKLGFEAIGDDSTISIKSSGVASKPVLSTQGVLSIKAANVVQSGVLTAPFGQIIIDAIKSASFAAGSSTSVSGNNQIIPFGITTTGGEIYNPNAGVTTPLLEKNISIKAGKVDLQKNAVLDLSAGGDMFAYEFVPGIGGTKDILAQPNTYAVIPNLGNDYAAFDQGYSDSSTQVGIGQTVFLTGISGLATGSYTLLPARYALAPGAFLVEANVIGGKLLPKQVAPQLDGSTFTTGYLGELGTGAHDANWSTFKVTDGAVFRPAAGTVSKAPSQYILTSATEFFSDPLKTNGKKVSLPKDVGRLSVDAAKLALDSIVVANKVADGKGLNVDISSSNIRVVNSQDLSDTSSLQLTAASINALNAESLLLGGSRKLQDGVVNVTTGAETVSVENNNNSVIKTPEFIATATKNVTVKKDAVVDTSVASKTPSQTIFKADGDGALLALSSTSDISYSRTGSSSTSTIGELNIEAGSTLKAGNSVVLDASKSASLLGNVTLQDGGSATFGANRILLGNAALGTVGLNVNAAALAALGQLKALTLNSYNNIDTFGTVKFGNNKLDLTMNAAGIVGHLANDESVAPINAVASVITANTFTLKNTQGSVFTEPTDPSGRGLEINATTVKLDGGAIVNGSAEITGYNKLAVNADEIRVANIGEAHFNVAETKLTTGRITADTAANYKITSTDKLEIVQPSNVKVSTEKGFGATLDISAKDLTIASNIDLSSGKLALIATNDLNIISGATISATSIPNTFYNTTEYAPAGSVTLNSTTGNVNVNAGAVIDVTSQGDADAGLVKVLATSGTANFMGELKGSATGTGKGGVLDVDVNSLADFSTTNNRAAGFDEGRHYRIRTGDVAITGTGTNALKAREIIVSVDAGKIIVLGDIVATEPKNGRIGLFAGNGVTLENTANLMAKSSNVGAEGGKVDIETTTGSLDFKGGSQVNTSGGIGGQDGEVYLGAARTADNTDINVTNMATTFVGTKKIDIGGLDSIEVDSVTTAKQTTAINKAETFMKSVTANSTKGLQRLGISGDSRFAILPVVEFKNSNQTIANGNLTISNSFDLHTWRFDPVTGQRVTDTTLLAKGLNADGKPLLAGVLNLKAKGDILVNNTISDGFSSASLGEISQSAIAAVPEIPAVLDADGNEITAPIAAVTAKVATGVTGLNSWSYRIVSGADFFAANPLANNDASTGNITLANNMGIRTGTGSIDIAAAGNLNMGGAGSVIYTVGHNAAPLIGFDAPDQAIYPLYLTDGGDININVKGNVVGKELTTSNRQLINNWLFRSALGSGNNDTSWWVRPDKFQQSTATLGGGNLNVNAGGSIHDFSASAATTARFDTNGKSGNQSVDGGGDVKVTAGGDISNGIYFVAKGEGIIKTGAAIKKNSNAAGSIGTILALQDGSFNVSANKDVFIQAVINPTLFGQSNNAGQVVNNTDSKLGAYFNSYSDTASINASSLTGDVDLFGKFSDIKAKDISNNLAASYLPSKFNAVSFNGNIKVASGATLLPSTNGNLKLLASNNIEIGSISMLDADSNMLPKLTKPTKDLTLISTAITNKAHALTLIHKNDVEPALVVAENGDIFKPVGDSVSIISLPKIVKIVAGKDINNVTLDIQNNNASDITLIKAGNDVKVKDVTVSGPGNLLLQAGRNIDLSTSQGDIATTGSSGLTRSDTLVQSSNTALPTDGASITLQAGLGKGANVQAYIEQYILPTGTGPLTLAGDASKLSEYRAATALAVIDYVRKTTSNALVTDAEAFTIFNGFNLEAKTIFANRHLSSELIASAKGFAKAGNHNRGITALNILFPDANQGDILLYASKVTTNSGGSIDMLAPGGLINVGAPGKAFKDNFTNSGEIGVITEKGGEIRAIVDKDFQVNQSKVITQFGSDISIWSTNGTIDAGRGSKTATSVPERIVLTDADGNTTIEVRGVAAGSGIRAQSYDPDGPNGPKKAPKKGNIYLTAPRVDAGEAGIEAGDLLIVAPIVLNASNIQVQGTSSGVPIAAATGVVGAGAGLSPDSVNAAVAQVAQSVAQSANQPFVKPSLPSIISVDIIGIGN